MHTTDFMYFISSSYFLRFGETEQFQNNITIDIDRARKDPYNHIHRSVLKQLREQIPDGSNFRLYPFTIKKNTNVYGIIFGAAHPLAIDKFLRADDLRKSTLQTVVSRGQVLKDANLYTAVSAMQRFHGVTSDMLRSSTEPLREQKSNSQIFTVPS